MPIREVNRSEDGAGNERNLYEAPQRQPRHRESPHHPLLPGDTAEVTRPDQAVLRLLAERILQAVSLSLRLRRCPATPRSLEPADPEVWAVQLIQEFHLLAARARLVPSDPPLWVLFAQACRQGTEETLEVLGDLALAREPALRARVQAAANALSQRFATSTEHA